MLTVSSKLHCNVDNYLSEETLQLTINAYQWSAFNYAPYGLRHSAVLNFNLISNQCNLKLGVEK